MIKIDQHSVVEIEGMVGEDGSDYISKDKLILGEKEAWEILWAYLCVKNDATYAVYFKDGIVIGDRNFAEKGEMKS